MAGPPRITLFFDIVSPFAYEAYYILRNSDVFRACDVHYVPIFLGGIMHMCGNTAPILIKNKDKWIMKERLRWARAFGIPMKEELLPGFPPKTLMAMRALCILALVDKEKGSIQLTNTMDVLFRRIWVEHCDIQDPEVLKDALQSVVGKEASKVMERAATEGKAILAANTTTAFEAGAFGVPWMVCTNTARQTEGFWGVDHLGQVVQFLRLNKPTQGGWRALL